MEENVAIVYMDVVVEGKRFHSDFSMPYYVPTDDEISMTFQEIKNTHKGFKGKIKGKKYKVK